jgi:hypothetical protein
MTKLLTELLREVEGLPEDRQNDVAHVIQAMLANDATYDLTDEALQ